MTRLYDLAVMTVSGTPGTGTITLGAAATVNGVTYLSFAAAGVQNGDVVDYSISDTGASEVGTGTYTTVGTTLTRAVTKSTNSNAAISASSSAIVRISPRAESLLQTPNLQRITATGAGTYTTPAGALFLRIRMSGAGSGGGGGGTGASNGTAGGNTTFDTLTANGGGASNAGNGGAGGTVTGGNVIPAMGNAGLLESTLGTGAVGGSGGASPFFGGAGKGGGLGTAGGAAGTNSGGGGGAGGSTASTTSGGGGGASGGCIEHVITSPASSYSYSVGAKGTGGTAGTSGGAGGDGGDGVLIVEAYFLA